MVPIGVMRPSPTPNTTNQTFPSGPGVSPPGSLPLGMSNSVTTPVGVIRPIFRAFPSANQRFPSGPDVMPETPATGVGTSNSVIRVRQVPFSQYALGEQAIAQVAPPIPPPPNP